MVTDPVLYRTEGNREGWGLGTVVTGEEYAFKDAGVLFSPIAAVQEEHRPMLISGNPRVNSKRQR